MVYFLLWIALSVAVGLLADKRGRSIGAWVMVSLLCSPLVGFIFLLVMDDRAYLRQQPAEPMRSCVACAELVLSMATVCKHCGAALTPDKSHEVRRDQAISAQAEWRETSNQGLVIVAAVVGIVILIYLLLRFLK